MPEYIDWFRYSSSYINAHRKKVFVVLLPGEALEHPNFSNIVHDITLLNSLGVKLVLVHGSRPQINAALKNEGIESRYHKGLRITDAESLQVVKKVIGSLSIDIEAVFSMGLANSPMHGADLALARGNYITARPLGVLDGIDHALTGVVRKVNTAAIQQHLEGHNIVLLNNLGYSPTGEVFNLSAEEVATEVAVALHAEKLILFIPQRGIVDAADNMVSTLNPASAQNVLDAVRARQENMENGIAQALVAALKACSRKVPRSHLISFVHNGALIEELFTRDGSGTLVSAETFEVLRPATIDDVGGLLELITPLEEAGVLVHRSRELLEAEIGFFFVIEREGMIIACAALYPLDEQCGEIACIAIHRNYQDTGRGKDLLVALEAHAKRSGLSKVIVLTTQTTHWFLEKGFTPIEISELPEKKKKMYNYQRNSKALAKSLN
ncbi:MAG: amino-acid N-acetyltransferase [Pseudomonadales bacterium]|nr:amino-acid N-acetyltransferase [Pseudomonadales bacterium]MCP5357920.1 amino-acid N-acetyltransferase [Pseudomonadales bacterium]